MLVQTHWLIPCRTRRVMLDALLVVVSPLGRMGFSVRVVGQDHTALCLAFSTIFSSLILGRP